MSNILFGPASKSFTERYLYRDRGNANVRTFGPEGCDHAPPPGATWSAVAAEFPPGWTPELLVLWLPYTSVPLSDWVWSAPVPVVCLAGDWNLCWHSFRQMIPLCDTALTDEPGRAAFRRAGFDHVHAANLHGLGREFFDEWDEESPGRDIDVLFVGSMNPAVHRDRVRWLGRVARLADRHAVTIATETFGRDYRDLLRRAKVVFNRSVRGECNQRAFEAAACGAVVLQEAENRAVANYLAAGAEYVPYTGENFEECVRAVLADDGRRAATAAAARGRVKNYSFEALLRDGLARLDPAELQARMRRRLDAAARPSLVGRAWQRVNLSGADADPVLSADLAATPAGDPFLGLLAEERAVAEPALRRAAAVNRVSALTLAEALARTDPAAAIREVEHVLDDLDLSPLTASELDTPAGARRFDTYRVEWEAAAWRPADEAGEKARLLRWRAFTLLAELTGDVTHFHEAAAARPDLPGTRAALGCSLARAGRLREAIPHLREACRLDPFDGPAARAYWAALTDAGEAVAAGRFLRDRQLLRRAAPGLVGDEAPDPPSVGDELASVVVLCCNAADVSRVCLDSVLAHTRPPFEVVVVDNGSTDATPDLLAEVATRPGPVRVRVIRNAENRGFAAGVNQALAAAAGAWVVLLNNDVVVTPRWLDRLIAPLVGPGDRPAVVGPVTTAAPAPQHVPAPYHDLRDLDAFAHRHWLTVGRRCRVVPRLTGFCLVAARETVDRLGPMDERFGVGFFEDDDWCARARTLGLRMAVHEGVFVHHFGGRTFAALGLNADELLDRNFALFREKWGEAEAAPYVRLAAPPARVSLTMIVKDEERNLRDCLAGLAPLFHEIVVVDTGSADGTKALAAELGARVFDFPWVDDFAAARNAALDRATGDYAFWLDADDRLDAENREKLARLFATLGGRNEAHVMKCRCLPDRPGGGVTVVDHVRLFPLRPGVRWEFRVHEQILPALRAAGTDVRWADVAIDHVGYTDPAVRGRKLERDTRLLLRELEERPGHPFPLFNLGSVHLERGRPADALPCLRASLAASEVRDSIVRKLYALIAQCHARLGDRAAARAAVREGRGHYPADAELLYLDGSLALDAGDPAAAERAFGELLAGRDEEHFGSTDGDLRGDRARQGLAAARAAVAAADRPAEPAAEPDELAFSIPVDR
jgi:glycosyltransferase involved in cell wall biosynthesis